MTLRAKTEAVLAFAYGGLHHVPGKIREKAGGLYFEVNIFGGLATYDFNELTRLVVACHEHCVRMEITNSGPGMIKLMFHDRKREGRMYERHPTLRKALEEMGIEI